MKKILRKNLAKLLTASTYRGIRHLDPSSTCAQKLATMDYATLLSEDIERICKTVSFSEITKILTLAAEVKVAPKEKRKDIKSGLKKIAERIIERTEKESGELKIPSSCRHLMFNL